LALGDNISEEVVFIWVPLLGLRPELMSCRWKNEKTDSSVAKNPKKKKKINTISIGKGRKMQMVRN